MKEEPVSIQVNEGTTPYHIGAPRRVAIPMLKPLKEELERMVKLGVIKPVDEPTEVPSDGFTQKTKWKYLCVYRPS